MKLKLSFVILLFCLFPKLGFSSPGNILDRVKQLTLPNGMKFLLLRRDGAPVFTAYMRVKVGGVDEPEGMTGIAHLLEHMAFKGTSEIGTKDPKAEKELLEKIEETQAKLLASQGAERQALAQQMRRLTSEAATYVVKEEFSQIYSKNGATNLNATTSQDLTSYFVSLPNTKLKLWAYLESSRLKDPIFREFYTERDVVREERRSRVDDSPFGKLYETLMADAFEQSPYRRPTIGYPQDLDKLSATHLREFYNRYYAPENIVVAIVGNIDLIETEKILREYFGGIPSGADPPELKVSEPQPLKAKTVRLAFDASPSLMVAYLKPTMPHRDDYVFDVFNELMCEGPTSRLYQRLVEQERLVQKIGCNSSAPGSRFDNLFWVFASLNKGRQPEEVLRVLDEEFQKVLSQGISEEELTKAKKNIVAEWYYDMQSNEDLAELLSYFESITGSWKYVQEHQRQIKSIGQEDIQRIVRAYLKPERSRVAILEPKKKA